MIAEKRNIVLILFDVATLVEDEENEEPSLDKREKTSQASQIGTFRISAVFL